LGTSGNNNNTIYDDFGSHMIQKEKAKWNYDRGLYFYFFSNFSMEHLSSATSPKKKRFSIKMMIFIFIKTIS